MGFDIYVSLFDIDAYRERIEPALRNYFACGESSEVLRLLEEVKLSSGKPSDEIQSSIDILNGTNVYSPAPNHGRPSPDAQSGRQDLDVYVRSTIIGQVLEGHCVPKIDGRCWEQNMGRCELVPYLYHHSSWIESAFTGGILDTGTKLDFPLGEHAEIMNSEKVRALLSELKTIPQPDPTSLPETAKQLSNLRTILETAAAGSGRAAVLYIA